MSSALNSPHELDAIDPYAVRWYYSATSTVMPGGLDIPGKSDFVRFSDGDSLLLETVYRKHVSEYDECWLQQQEACKQARKEKSPPPAPEPKQAELEPRGPVVRAGYFEADIKARSVYPVYWPGDQSTLMRGTWFVVSSAQGRNLIPLPHQFACKLEQAWQTRVYDCTIWDDHKLQPEGVHATRVDLSDVSEQNYYALFCDRNKIYLCSKDNLAFFKGLWAEAPGAMLVRGYSSAADAQTPQGKKSDQEEADLSSFESRTVGMAVRHVVMAVHGIGQRMGGRTIVEDAQAVRSRMNAILDDHMHDEIGCGYIQVLPIQWRKNLDLEADRVADRIMPEGARTFRMLAHNTCVEVLMYMSPSHAQNIVDSVANNLNTTYLKFIRRHPEFNGKISVLAYSLGSVLCYDLLSHQPMKESSALARGLDNLKARQTQEAERVASGIFPEGCMEGDAADRGSTRTAGVHGRGIPDAYVDTTVAAATPIGTPRGGPNSGRSEGPGPTAAEVDGDGEAGEGKSANSGSGGWAGSLWKAIAQKLLPSHMHDDGDQSTEEEGVGEGKEVKPGKGVVPVDVLGELLDAAPQRMKEEANKAKKSARKSFDSVHAKAQSRNCKGKAQGNAIVSAATSGTSTPAAGSPIFDGAPIFSDRSRNNEALAAVRQGENGAAGERLAAMKEGGDCSRKEEGGKDVTGDSKGQKGVRRWRISIPRPWGGKKQNDSTDGACESSKDSQVQEGEARQVGGAAVQRADDECCVDEVSAAEQNETVVGDSPAGDVMSLNQGQGSQHSAVGEGAECSRLLHLDEAGGRDEEGHTAGAAASGDEHARRVSGRVGEDAEVDAHADAPPPEAAADDSAVTSIGDDQPITSGVSSSRNVGNTELSGPPHEQHDTGVSIGQPSEALKAHNTGRTMSTSLDVLVDTSSPPIFLPDRDASSRDLCTTATATAASSSAAAATSPADVSSTSVHVAGHTFQDSSLRLGAVPTVVPATKAARVAESAMHGSMPAQTHSVDEHQDSMHAGHAFGFPSNPVHDAGMWSALLRENTHLSGSQPDASSSTPLCIGAAEDGRRCDGSATRVVSQLTRELSASAGALLPEASNHSSLQQLPAAESAAGLPHAHHRTQSVFADMHNAVPSMEVRSGGERAADAVFGNPAADSTQRGDQHKSMLTELQQLEEQQAQVNNRIALLRAAMRSDATSSRSLPHSATDVATDAPGLIGHDTRGVVYPEAHGPEVVTISDCMLRQQAAMPRTSVAASLAASLEGGSPLGMGMHHTYGMGELMDEEGDGVGEGGVLVEDGDLEQVGSPVKGTIELTRVLWPGNAMHELDQQEKVPLSTQAVQYPISSSKRMQKLFFDVDNFIMIGSPTGLFCALRGINPGQQTPLGSLAAGRLDPASAPGCLPVCRRFYNVFHPYDPVAYRMEPLVQSEEVPKPQHVPYHKHGRKLHIGLAETSENVARTMNQWQKGVAHAFTFSFKRSKSGSHERSAAVQDLQQWSLIPTILGAPIPLHPHESLPSLPTLDTGTSGLSGVLPSQPSALQHSLSHGPSSGAQNISNEGTNGASTSERTHTLERANTGTLNHSSLPPLAEEASNPILNETNESPVPKTSSCGGNDPSSSSTLQAADGAAAGANRVSGSREGIQGVPLAVPPRQGGGQWRRPKSVPASPEANRQYALPSPSEPCMLSVSSPELLEGSGTYPQLTLQLPLVPNPTLPGSNTGSPVSSNISTPYRTSCDQHPTEHGTTLHRRSSVPRLQTTAPTSDAPSVHSSMHAAYASLNAAPPLHSPSMLSLPGAAPSIDGGSSIGGFRGGADNSGRSSGEPTTARLSKPKPTLAKAGQFGLVSKGGGGSVGRLDFQLQEDFAELQWVGAFKAHFCYWKHDDVALLICRAACGYDVVDGRKEEQPVEQEPVSPAP